MNSSRRRGTLMVGASALALGVLGALPAIASINGMPQITEISNASKVVPDQNNHSDVFAAPGAVSSFTVDYVGSAAGSYRGVYHCTDQGDTAATTTIAQGESGTVVSYPVVVPDGATACTFRVDHFNTSHGSWNIYGNTVTLRFVPPQFAVSNYTNPSARVFYPRSDGYKDQWTAKFQANAPASSTMVVRTKSGKVLRSITNYGVRKTVGPSTWSWNFSVAWNGRRNDGSLVPNGTYLVTMAVKSAVGTGARTLGPVEATVNSGTQTLTISKRFYGHYYATTASSGACGAKVQPNGSTWLVCTGGNFASATYRLPVPGNATILSQKAAGTYGGDDQPGHGTITRTFTRPKSTQVQYKVTVTDRRAWVVLYVDLTYRYTRTI